LLLPRLSQLAPQLFHRLISTDCRCIGWHEETQPSGYSAKNCSVTRNIAEREPSYPTAFARAMQVCSSMGNGFRRDRHDRVGPALTLIGSSHVPEVEKAMTAPKVVRTMCPMNCHPTFCGMLVEVEGGKLKTVQRRPGQSGQLGEGETRPIYEILGSRANSLGFADYFPWASLEEILDAILDHPTGHATVTSLRAAGGFLPLKATPRRLCRSNLQFAIRQDRVLLITNCQAWATIAGAQGRQRLLISAGAELGKNADALSCIPRRGASAAIVGKTQCSAATLDIQGRC
jgi:hypothetical protein